MSKFEAKKKKEIEKLEELKNKSEAKKGKRVCWEGGEG